MFERLHQRGYTGYLARWDAQTLSSPPPHL